MGVTGSTLVLVVGLILRRSVLCSQLVHELPQLSMSVERVLSSSEKVKYLLDVPEHKLENVILVKDFEYADNSQVYVIDKLREEMCSAQIEGSNKRLTKKCEKVEQIYVPLNELRISDKDIKRRDSSDMRKKASVNQKNYESKRDETRNLVKPEDSSGTSPSTVENSVKPSTKLSHSPAADCPLFKRSKSKKYVPLSERTGTLTKLKENDSWKKTLEDANIYSHIPTYKTESSKKIKEPTSNQDSEEL